MMNIVWKKPDGSLAVTWLTDEGVMNAREKAIADGVITLAEQLLISDACRIEGEKLKARGAIPSDWVAILYDSPVPADPIGDASRAAGEKAAVIAETIKLRDTVISRLSSIQTDAMIANDSLTVSAIGTAKTSLMGMTSHPTVIAATGWDETENALQAIYFATANQLSIDAPAAYAKFRELDT